jgi:hypothetical protein
LVQLPGVPAPLANSALLRQVNERILEVSTAWPGPAAPIGFLCECGAEGCVSVVTLARAEYEAICASPGGLVLEPGHAAAGAEVVAA